MMAALLESAVRSLLLAAAVWMGLKVFRVRNVLAQKAAWGLVLASALAMPALLPMAARWQWQPRGALVVPAKILDGWKAWLGAGKPGAAPQAVEPDPEPAAKTKIDGMVARRSSRFPAPAASDFESAAAAELPSVPVSQPSREPGRRLSALQLGWLVYLAVAAGLLARLLVGAVRAARLWMRAEPVHLDAGPAELRLRASREVASPVTVGRAVVLPAGYAAWDAAKLRMVLAHERSHIRQGDFYLQLAAGLYAALVWFSPLGWWIKRKLSELAEAISDRAALEEAASRPAYAEVLLEFAAMPRTTTIGVAMARTGSLSHRIERLLNDRRFDQAFEGTRRRALLVVLLVPAALFAVTAAVRVQAAGQIAQPAAEPAPQTQAVPAPTPAPPPEAGVSHPDADPDLADDPDPQAREAPPAPPPAGPVAPPSAAPAPPQHIEIPPIDVAVPPVHIPAIHVAVPPLPPMPTMASLDRAGNGLYLMGGPDGLVMLRGPGSASWYVGNGDTYALVDGKQFSGRGVFTPETSASIDKARKMAHGKFLWFRHEGKAYFVDDPEVVAQVEAMDRQTDALRKQQEELGKQQEKLGRLQEEITVPTPDVSKEMAELNQAMAKLQARFGKTVTQDELAGLEGKLGDLQGRLGALQGEMGARQGRLGAQQGKLGAEQGRLGAEQARLAIEAHRKVQSIMHDSLRNGKARPVN